MKLLVYCMMVLLTRDLQLRNLALYVALCFYVFEACIDHGMDGRICGVTIGRLVSYWYGLFFQACNMAHCRSKHIFGGWDESGAYHMIHP